MAHTKKVKGRGPGLIYILAALIIVGVAAARFFGFAPGAPSSNAAPDSDGARVEEQTPTNPQPSPAKMTEVLVYHTHTTENYKGKEPHERKGPGEVTAVGKALVDRLTQLGVGAVHVMTVHDLPDWNQATANAAKSVEEALRRNSGVRVVVDLHRDAVPPGEQAGYATLEADGQKYARILLIVGTSDNALAQANLKYAERLRDHLESEVPGITRGVRLMPQENNGRFHENSVTVFVGDYHENTLAEATASAGLLAEAIATLLREEG